VNCFQLSFVTSANAADMQPLVELVLEARAEVIVNVTDVDSVVIYVHYIPLCHLRTDSKVLNLVICAAERVRVHYS